MSEPEEITMACGNYDRTYALHAGVIQPDGVSLRCVDLPPSQIFVAATRDGAFDVAEMSLSMYLIGLHRGDDRFVAMPIFPLRAMRHRDIYTARNGGVTHPSDLAGRAVGLRHFHMTSAVWQRGILADDFSLGVDQVRWVRAEVETAGPASGRIWVNLPLSIEVETVTTASLLDMTESGQLAAALIPASATEAREVRRLFADVREVESSYFHRTGIHPIMHVMVLRREIVERYPWLSERLMIAFEQAKAVAYARAQSAASPYMSPFHLLDLERDQTEFGQDLYPYGVEPNKDALETFARYCHTQGLTGTLPPVPEWFTASGRRPAAVDASPSGAADASLPAGIRSLFD